MEKYTEEELSILIDDLKNLDDVLENENADDIRRINDSSLRGLVEEYMQTFDDESLEKYLYNKIKNVDKQQQLILLDSLKEDHSELIIMIWKGIDKEVQQAWLRTIIGR